MHFQIPGAHLTNRVLITLSQAAPTEKKSLVPIMTHLAITVSFMMEKNGLILLYLKQGSLVLKTFTVIQL